MNGFAKALATGLNPRLVTDAARIGQSIIMGLPGPELTDGLRRLIRQINPGGYIFFTRNLATPGQVFQLITELQSMSDLPLIFTIDQEGGRVSRLKVLGEEPPSAADLRDYGGVDVCAQHGTLMGRVLRSLGFNLNLCPVVDYCIDEAADNSLRGRCYGRTPDEVIEKASAFQAAMQAEGVHATAKHFPGYTFCEKDPHGALPLITRSRDELMANEIRVFQHFARTSEAVMIGHGHFTAYHEEPLPASLSPLLIRQVLRSELKFQGIVMTDDLEMGAVANAYGSAEASRQAILAGNDFLLICHNPACAEIAHDALKELPDSNLAETIGRVESYRKTLALPPATFDPTAFSEINAEIGAFRKQIRGS
jgi:beta-N-acetylhexosaminidase